MIVEWGNSTGEMPKAEGNPSGTNHPFCSFEFFDFVLSLLYMFLFVWSVMLATDSNREWSMTRSPSFSGNKGGGVLYYLNRTALLCFARCLSFALSLYKDGPENTTTATEKNYKDEEDYCRSIQDASFQWEVHGSEDLASRGSYWISLILVLLSTISTALFFSSYTFFAHSLTRVLDAVIESHTLHNQMLFGNSANAFSVLGKWMFGFSSSPNQSAHTTYHSHQTRIMTTYGDIRDVFSERTTCLSASLLTLNGLVWISVAVVWTSLTIHNKYYALFADHIGQLIISIAVLILAAIFSIHFTRAVWFLREWRSTSTESTLLTQLLRLRHILGVICVCTLCFVARALLILMRWHLSAMAQDVYFLLFEAAPTCYMLYALLRSGGAGQLEQTLRDGGEYGHDAYTNSNSDKEDNFLGAGSQSTETSRLLADSSSGVGGGRAANRVGNSSGGSTFLTSGDERERIRSNRERNSSHESLMALSMDPRDDFLGPGHIDTEIDDADDVSLENDGQSISTTGLSLEGKAQIRNAHLLDDYL